MRREGESRKETHQEGRSFVVLPLFLQRLTNFYGIFSAKKALAYARMRENGLKSRFLRDRGKKRKNKKTLDLVRDSFYKDAHMHTFSWIPQGQQRGRKYILSGLSATMGEGRTICEIQTFQGSKP